MVLPLEGIRVLDLSRMLAGPFGSMLLADQGAEIIKIEEPETGDAMRGTGLPDSFILGESLHFFSVNRNKKSVILDLKVPEARQVFYDLVKVSDVVFDNYRPGVMARFGADYGTLSKINPGIICCSVSGFGADGPYRDRPAWDIVIQALSGVMSVTAEPGRSPLRVGLPIGDVVPAIYAAFAIVTALQGRERTGKGCYIDLSMLDCMSTLLVYTATRYLATGIVPPPLGGRHMTVAPWGAYKARDGYFVIGVPGDSAWSRFCGALGLTDLEKDPRFTTNDRRMENLEELTGILDRFFASDDIDHWLKVLLPVDVVCSPIYNVDGVLADPQIRARNMVVEVEHPVAGKYRMMGNPIKGSISPRQRLDPPPIFGEHTEEVLRSLLGYPEEKIEELRELKAV